ncbi:TPA: N-acetyltransferase [candidate division WOR-3 bacterium]|jgi:UDP-2-acetamido-3-amino-2,3-dideoxy-glucuronate N-acetyltransferase|uniref:N-acetyltransferase n=1 Tax=candidate division WOR-3 bacterium TaxID=2052148 RepID=A0A350HAD8_UNCW3|nr:N-acetyltransferase [candidate division WOR-3 bacterium]
MKVNKYFVHQSSYVDKGAKIGEGTKIWHFSHIMQGAVIGKNCIIGQSVTVENRAVVGDRVKIQNNVSVYGLVTVEDDVFLGPSMVFTNDLNPRAPYPKHGEWVPTLVKKGASIGANATIVCGITIGKWAFIGAGAVVTKNVPDYFIAVGNPAKIVGYMCECGYKMRNIKHPVESKTEYKCQKCGRIYEISLSGVKEK